MQANEKMTASLDWFAVCRETWVALMTQLIWSHFFYQKYGKNAQNLS